MQSKDPNFYEYVLSNIDFDYVIGAPREFYTICENKIIPAVVLTYLAKRCNRESVQIRKSEIAEALRINESMVFSSLKYLREKGFITTTFAKESEPPHAPLLMFTINHKNIMEAIG